MRVWQLVLGTPVRGVEFEFCLFASAFCVFSGGVFIAF